MIDHANWGIDAPSIRVPGGASHRSPFGSTYANGSSRVIVRPSSFQVTTTRPTYEPKFSAPAQADRTTRASSSANRFTMPPAGGEFRVDVNSGVGPIRIRARPEL